MDSALRLRPNQEALTPAQEAEAWRFADERIRAQLATSLADKQAAEAPLKHAYAVAGLPPPTHIRWLDGPLHLVTLAPQYGEDSAYYKAVALGVQERVVARVSKSVGRHPCGTVWASVESRVAARVKESVRDSIWVRVRGRVQASAGASVRQRMRVSMYESV